MLSSKNEQESVKLKTVVGEQYVCNTSSMSCMVARLLGTFEKFAASASRLLPACLLKRKYQIKLRGESL